MRLSSAQQAVFDKYGKELASGDLAQKPLAKKLGVSEWCVRQATLHAYEVYGRPDPLPIHLVIPDAHATPKQSNERFTWLGRVIAQLGKKAMADGNPFRVISIGDFGDFHSLSSYDKGHHRSWGSTYRADVACFEDAINRMREEVPDKVWDYADKHWCEGNHENRINRYMNEHPELIGHLPDARFLMKEAGFQVHEFLTWANIDGLGYSHYMQNNSGRPVAGINVARSLVLQGHRSVVVGHNHRLDTFTTTDCFGGPIMTLSCGCYFGHSEEYAGQSNDRWWRGLCVLTDVKNGGFNLTTMSYDSIEKKFGGER